jgi:hypothetical protein
MADFLSEKRAEIERRLEELRPLADEYARLEQAKAALDGVEGPQQRGGRGSGRPSASSSGNGRRRSPANGRRRAANGRRRPANGRRRRAADGRRRRSGGRSAEVLELVRQNPGITVTELADRLGMKQRNYLYRITSNLESDGAITKRGRELHAR